MQLHDHDFEQYSHNFSGIHIEQSHYYKDMMI